MAYQLQSICQWKLKKSFIARTAAKFWNVFLDFSPAVHLFIPQEFQSKISLRIKNICIWVIFLPICVLRWARSCHSLIEIAAALVRIYLKLKWSGAYFQYGYQHFPLDSNHIKLQDCKIRRKSMLFLYSSRFRKNNKFIFKLCKQLPKLT